MAPRSAGRRLIVNADDFGRSSSINRAVIRAHQEGILTTASLMVTEASFNEAVELARQNPRLGVGLHLTLLCGHSALDHDQIPGLINERREFSDNATAAGFKYFWHGTFVNSSKQKSRPSSKGFRSTRVDHGPCEWSPAHASPSGSARYSSEARAGLGDHAHPVDT